VAIAILKVEGEGVINIGADTVVLERCAKLIPVWDPNDILIEYMAILMVGSRQGNTETVTIHVLKESIVLNGILSSLLRPTVKIPQFDPQNGRLKGIEATIQADVAMVVFGTASVDPEDPDLVSKTGVPGNHHSSITKGSEVLGRVE
jgi:hypothetical protein